MQALALEFGERADTSHDGALVDSAAADSTFYEITIATVDQPKLLSRLSDAMVRVTAATAAAGVALNRPFTAGGTLNRPFTAAAIAARAGTAHHTSNGV